MTTGVFGATVVALLLIAAIGFSLYLAKPTVTETTTETLSETAMQTTAATMTGSMSGAATVTTTQEAVPFAKQTGQMIGNAWLLIQPAGMTGRYALSVYASGLDQAAATGGTYVVEGVETGGSMGTVPVTGNVTSSELDVGSGGVGQFFALLSQDPHASFESIQIFYLPGMQMSDATLVATAQLSTM